MSLSISGYALALGDFTGKKQRRKQRRTRVSSSPYVRVPTRPDSVTDLVVGMPRAANLTGKVRQEKPTKYVHINGDRFAVSPPLGHQS